jgi:hypothetical protein
MTYLRDPLLDTGALYQKRARRNDSNDAIEMRGTFKPALLADYIYDHIFEPNDDGQPTFVIPVFKGCRVIDILAISGNVWGCTTGQGQYIGTLSDPLRVYRSPSDWIAGDIGVLPLARSFFPSLRLADSIIAEDEDQAEQIAELAFIAPAIQFGLDVNAAEQAARAKISF